MMETRRTEPSEKSLSLQEHCARSGLWDLGSFLSVLYVMVHDVTSFTPVDVKAMEPLDHGPESTNYEENKSFPLRR